jgi:alpha,alpha-trehalase
MLSAKKARITSVALLLWFGFTCSQSSAAKATRMPETLEESRRANQQGLAEILDYIARGWDSLTRSLANCETFEDVKSNERPVLYLPAAFSASPAIKNLEKSCRVTIQHLPAAIEALGGIDTNAIQPQGLLYLPNPYVVPGGRFNEMYGWDSYFIIRGLLQAGKLKLARGIVDNFFFEIERYGAVLNANRTYYLTRSQPPFLTSMILAVYESEKSAGNDDLAWLAKAYPFAVRDYDFWTRDPHLAGSTGLSRYYDFGTGPAPEVLASTPQYYRYVAAYFLRHPEAGSTFLAWSRGETPSPAVLGQQFPIYVCDGAKPPSAQDCNSVERVSLNARFYKGDRSMRESGFDVSFRFGPLGANTPDYAPVCLNSLLYKTERDLERISLLLGRKKEAREWERRGTLRGQRINEYLWDQKRGLFLDYDFVKQEQSSYQFATTFYPLWSGVASPQQAKAVAANLRFFLEPGGLVTSRRETKAQWDYPYGWAPLQLIAVEGLRRYGFNEDANRIAYRFLGTVLQNFRRDGTIREKYNVVTRSSDTQVQAGYRQNVVGFGWTNGVFLALLHNLPESWKKRLREDEGQSHAELIKQKP